MNIVPVQYLESFEAMHPPIYAPRRLTSKVNDTLYPPQNIHRSFARSLRPRVNMSTYGQLQIALHIAESRPID